MNIPLEDVEGRDGTLEDVFGRPIVIVFDTKDKIGREDHQNRKDIHNVHNPFLFVNMSTSLKGDTSSDKLIRSHVRRKHTQQENGNSRPRRPRSVLLDRDAARNELSLQTSLLSQPGRSLDPFACYPVPMQPHMYNLLHNYLTVLVHAWFPKQADRRQTPRENSLFELAMSDAALFHAIMCSSSVCLDIAYGRSESAHSIIHSMEAIHFINIHLKASSRISDATIGAVAFLAIIEFILGNHEASNIHKTGLIQMINLRGGLKDLSFSLQGKVWLICSAASNSNCLPDCTSSTLLSLAPPLSQQDKKSNSTKCLKMPSRFLPSSQTSATSCSTSQICVSSSACPTNSWIDENSTNLRDHSATAFFHTLPHETSPQPKS